MPKAHAILSASGAHRWLECTPSAQLEATLAATTSIYAEEGTIAHELAEICALFKTGQITVQEYNDRFAEIKTSGYYSAEMQEYCDAYADFIVAKREALVEKAGDLLTDVLLEARIRFSDWVPDGFGTADCLILAEGYMEVIDFKYGKGKRVDAFQNPQMRLYTLGAYQTYGLIWDVENVTMTIYQPRIANGITSDEIKLEELLDWAENYVKPRAALAIQGKGDFCPSEETCRFCRAKATCKARAEENLKLFDDAPDRYLLTVEEAGAILEKAGDIEAWLSDLRSYVEGELMTGTQVPGWKLVEGRSVRRFADEKAVAEALIADGVDPALIYKPRELLTLTQLEKDFGKKYVAETLGGLIIKPVGKPTLAPESDRRPAITPEEQLIKQFD